jgi:8-oxo-dGTP pyrophosphatase MutT (NUDIX family)
MPAFASKKQYRLMMAILHGKPGTTARGDKGPPKSVAEKYTGSGKNVPDSKDKAHHGGKWTAEHHKRHAEKHRSKEKKLEKGRGGSAVVVVNDKGQLLMGRQVKDDYRWSFPGGHIDDGESHKDAAVRELEEETGVSIDKGSLIKLHEDGKDKVYLVRLDHTPASHSTEELADVGFYDIDDLDFNKLRDCCTETMAIYLKTRLAKGNKPLNELIKLEEVETLTKNIIRTGQVADAVYEFRHGDAMRLVGNGAFRALKRGVEGMGDDEIRDVNFGNYTLHVRKHANDIYSGRIDDGLKTIHQFVNRSLPALTGELMSVFEWYDSDQNPDMQFHEDHELSDETITDGMHKLISNYRSYNIADIYDEMETIREEIRQGNAVDLQQAEQKIMGLFDRLEEQLDLFRDKHNGLTSRLGDEIDEIEQRLISMQNSIDKLSSKPSKIEAFSSNPANPSIVHSQYYEYLSRPKVVISPTGHVVVDFNADWTSGDKENFLGDLRVKVIKKSKK